MICLETPHRKWASSRLEGRTSWNFSSCGRCSRLTTGTSGTHSGGLRKGQSPCDLLGGLSGFLSRRSWDLRPVVELVPEPEDSSPVLTWILGYFWSLPHFCSQLNVSAFLHVPLLCMACKRGRCHDHTRSQRFPTRSACNSAFSSTLNPLRSKG